MKRCVAALAAGPSAPASSKPSSHSVCSPSAPGGSSAVLAAGSRSPGLLGEELCDVAGFEFADPLSEVPASSLQATSDATSNSAPPARSKGHPRVAESASVRRVHHLTHASRPREPTSCANGAAEPPLSTPRNRPITSLVPPRPERARPVRRRPRPMPPSWSSHRRSQARATAPNETVLGTRAPERAMATHSL